jgi:hypothetical protein
MLRDYFEEFGQPGRKMNLKASQAIPYRRRRILVMKGRPLVMGIALFFSRHQLHRILKLHLILTVRLSLSKGIESSLGREWVDVGMSSGRSMFFEDELSLIPSPPGKAPTPSMVASSKWKVVMK